MKEKKTEMPETRIGRLGLLEKAALLSGGGAWKSRALPRRGLPALFFEAFGFSLLSMVRLQSK